MEDLTGTLVKYVLGAPSKNAGEIRTAIVLKHHAFDSLNLMVCIEKDDFKSGRVKNIRFNNDEIPEMYTIGRVVLANSPDESDVYYVNDVSQGTEYGHWFDDT